MKIAVKDILAVPTEIDYVEPVEELNAMLRRGQNPDYEFRPPLEVHLAFYRAQADLFFEGRCRGVATATCGRCLCSFPLEVENAFTVVLRPEVPLTGEIELAARDLAESFYRGPEVDVQPLVYEQALLALPTRPLCAEECRGLCPACGANRNSDQCSCTAETGDPRLAVLRTLKIDRGVRQR